MTAGAWPPPPDAGTVWRHVWWSGQGGRERVRVRPVRLWGREVLVNAEGCVYCHGCDEFLDAGELGQVDNGHPVGLPNRSQGVLLPLADGGPP